jgi:exo-beta-1,3-glucanase (GH17 family)
VGPDGRRLLGANVLARKAICYSGYRAGQSPDSQVYPSEAQIKQDLELLLRGGWTFLRLFDASPHAERTLKVIKDNGFDMRVMLGVWISGPKAKFDTQNQADIDRGVSLASAYPGIVVAVSVGNETLDEWSNIKTPPADLAAYIEEVRGRIAQPVTTDDMYVPFTMVHDDGSPYPDLLQVVKAIDFAAVHAYPYLDAPWDSWDWKQTKVPAGPQRAVAMMNAALDYTKDAVRKVRKAAAAKNIDLPVVLGEAGWKDTEVATSGDPSAVEPFAVLKASLPHPVNQKMFYDGLMSWIHDKKDADSPATGFPFEAFDEPWKTSDGDGNWGLFDAKRVPKYVLWDAFPDLKPAGAPEYAAKDAVYYKQ